MDIMTKISIGVLMVICGGMAFLVGGAANCDSAKHIEYCKQAMSVIFWIGQAVAIGGVILTFLVVKFTKPDSVKPKTEKV